VVAILALSTGLTVRNVANPLTNASEYTSRVTLSEESVGERKMEGDGVFIFDLGPKNWRYVSHHGAATFLRKNKEYFA
jgi:hypothetical protein